jgi:hypothetical protein
MNNNPVRYSDPSGHCVVLCTAIIGAAVGAIVGAVGYTAYVAATGNEFNTGHMLLAAGGGAIAGALIGTGVGIVAGLTTAEATAAATTGATTACADGDCTNEANALVKMGEAALKSPEAQSLAQKIATSATRNPDSPWVSLGKNGLYQKDGYTYFELPTKAWDLLSKGGTKFVEKVNGEFMYKQMEAAKSFSISLGGGDPGLGTQFELNILNAAVKAGSYIEVVKKGLYIAR